MKAKEFGQMGEDSAAAFLWGKGYKILGRNVRIGHLETDIIAEKDGCIAFVEVKTRSEYPNAYHAYGRPASAVDKSKQQKLKAAASEYLRRNREKTSDFCARIDIVEVYLKPNCDKYKVLKIVHMENAVHG